MIAFLVYALLVAVVVYFGTSGKTYGHQAPSGWQYDQWCCNLKDCKPLDDGDVKETGGGWLIQSLGILVPYSHPEIRPSGDEHFHRCEYPIGSGVTRCFYVPPGGV